MKKILLILALSLLLMGCYPTYTVEFQPSEGYIIGGTILVKPMEKGSRFIGTVGGLEPGLHGFHIHEFGDCSDNGKAAGAHYNPHNSDHGPFNAENSHVGDLGNILADKNGNAPVDIRANKVELTGEHSVVGKAMIIHEKADDFSQPHGNAGGRIACGIIK